jgi:hypothetical protein
MEVRFTELSGAAVIRDLVFASPIRANKHYGTEKAGYKTEWLDRKVRVSRCAPDCEWENVDGVLVMEARSELVCSGESKAEIAEGKKGKRSLVTMAAMRVEKRARPETG